MRVLNDYVFVTKSTGCHRYLHWGEQNLLKEDVDSGWSGLSYSEEKVEKLTFAFDDDIRVSKIVLKSCIGRIQKSSPGKIVICSTGPDKIQEEYIWNHGELFAIDFDTPKFMSEMTMEISAEPLRDDGKYFKQLNSITFIGTTHDTN